MTRCRCGAPLVRPAPADRRRQRARYAGELLEFCRCSAGCGQTTSIIVETCGHGAALVSEDGVCTCVECGHEWRQVGAPCWAETRARSEARQVML
jgi:hypothetical protein